MAPTPARVRSAIDKLDVFHVIVGGERHGLSEALIAFVSSELKGDLAASLAASQSLEDTHEGAGGLTRFAGAQLTTGDPARTAVGIFAFLGVPEQQLWRGMSSGVAAIVEEWERAGTALDRECLDYVLRQTAGSNTRRWPHSGDRLMDAIDGDDDGRAGQPLSYFFEHPNARKASLLLEHVLCLRLYTTAAYGSINQPLRAHGAYAAHPHPLPVTVAFLHEGIKRLRAANTKEDETGVGKMRSLDLWRGMRNLELPPGFRESGGTEFAPLSTSRDIRVALNYSNHAEKRLLFKVVTDSFIDRGADLQFLSAFPQEVECLYPPLTLLLPTGREDTINVSGVEYSVIEVEPRFAS